jgi:ABC-type uncharacterized transport system permease subunit
VERYVDVAHLIVPVVWDQQSGKQSPRVLKQVLALAIHKMLSLFRICDAEVLESRTGTEMVNFRERNEE